MEENAVTARSAEDISIDIQKNADLFADACIIIDGTNAVVQRSLNTALVIRNSLGKEFVAGSTYRRRGIAHGNRDAESAVLFAATGNRGGQDSMIREQKSQSFFVCADTKHVFQKTVKK